MRSNSKLIEQNMIKHITQNELLLLAYNEAPPTERDEMLAYIANDSGLLAEYSDLLRQCDMLNAVSLEPNPTSVQIVLEQSCSSSSLETI
jgi:hypothetical protein